jgi:Methyltransferase FkbM domain
MNHLANVTVVEAAVSDFDGISQFDCGGSAVAGHLSADGGLAVRTISLDHEIDCGALPEPDYIKIDAEGAELRILQGARGVITRRHPTLSVEPHQWLPEFPTVRQDCIQFLFELGYTLSERTPRMRTEERISALHLSCPEFHARMMTCSIWSRGPNLTSCYSLITGL